MISSLRRASSSCGIADWTMPSRASHFSSLSSTAMAMSSGKECTGVVERICERVDLGACVVHAERCTACGGNAEPLQERHGAMGAGTNCEAAAIDDHRNVMGMNAREFEGEDRALPRCIADDPQLIDRPQPFGSLCSQI